MKCVKPMHIDDSCVYTQLVTKINKYKEKKRKQKWAYWLFSIEFYDKTRV